MATFNKCDKSVLFSFFIAFHFFLLQKKWNFIFQVFFCYYELFIIRISLFFKLSLLISQLTHSLTRISWQEEQTGFLRDIKNGLSFKHLYIMISMSSVGHNLNFAISVLERIKNCNMKCTFIFGHNLNFAISVLERIKNWNMKCAVIFLCI